MPDAPSPGHTIAARVLAAAVAALAVPAALADGASAPTRTAPQGTPTRSAAMSASSSTLGGELMALLPETLAGWQRVSIEQPLTTPERGPQPAVRARYKQGEVTATVDVTTAVPPGSRGARRWSQRAQGKDHVVLASLSNGIVFAATGRAEPAALEALLKAVDLDRAEKLRNKH